MKIWRVDEAERYTEAAPDGRNNSKGSSASVARLCTKEHGVVAESAKGQAKAACIAEMNCCFWK